MNISSNYYNYYTYGTYSSNGLLNANLSTASTDASQNETEAVNSLPPRQFKPMDLESLFGLSSSGKSIRDSLQTQGTGSDMSQKFEAVKTDMDAIKSADIESMSADEVKEMLTNLQNDLKAINSNSSSNSSQTLDISSLTESQTRDMLEDIQENAERMSAMGQGMPNQNGMSSDDFELIKGDLDTIKGLDISSMSAEEIKTTLTNLQNDTKKMSNPDEKAQEILSTDIENMSDSDAKSLLTKIQNEIKSQPSEGKGMRPAGPPPGGPPPGGPPPGGSVSSTDESDSTDTQTYIEKLLEMLNSEDSSTSSTDSTDSSDSIESIMQKLIDKLTENFNAADTSESSGDYADTIKDSLSSIFEQQRNSIDNLQSMLFSRLDSWNSNEQ